MLAAEFEHKARSARIADRLLRIGVPGHLVGEAVDLSKKELDTVIGHLGEAAPKPVKGATINRPDSFVRESVRRNISATVLVSIYTRLKKNTPDLAFAELFAPTWEAFTAALHPMPPGRLDIDARQAWSLIRFIEDGTLKTGSCHCCGSVFPRVWGKETKCVICYQIAFTHCQECGDPLERNQRLYDRKWKEGDLQAVCPRCRKRVDKEKARRSGMIQTATLSL